MKLAKTLQIDISDQNIFPLAAAPGEWAVAGTFSFVDVDAGALSGKEAIAFKSGWLGLGSFGRSTLVQVTTATSEDYEQAVRQLAGHLFSDFNAPDIMVALDAARREVDDMADLCDHPTGTLLAIGREARTEGIAESVRKIPPREGDPHARIWELEEDD